MCKWYIHKYSRRFSKCMSRNCKLCKLAYTDKILHINGYQLKKVRPVTCSASSAIYLFFCNKCDKSAYVGQTSNLRQRLTVHISDISTGKNTSVALHFKTCSLRHLRFSVLQIPREKLKQQPNKLNKWLSRTEDRWIKTLRSTSLGLNKMTKEDPKFATTKGDKEVPLILKYAPQALEIKKVAQNYITNHLPKLKSLDPDKPRSIIVTGVHSANTKLKNSLVRAKLSEME